MTNTDERASQPIRWLSVAQGVLGLAVLALPYAAGRWLPDRVVIDNPGWVAALVIAFTLVIAVIWRRPDRDGWSPLLWLWGAVLLATTQALRPSAFGYLADVLNVPTGHSSIMGSLILDAEVFAKYSISLLVLIWNFGGAIALFFWSLWRISAIAGRDPQQEVMHTDFTARPAADDGRDAR